MQIGYSVECLNTVDDSFGRIEAVGEAFVCSLAHKNPLKTKNMKSNELSLLLGFSAIKIKRR